MNKKATIVIVVLVLAALGAAIGYYQWNRKPDGVEDKEAQAITAAALIDAYAADENGANRNYLNKALAVSGTVTEVSANEDGKSVLLLGTDDPMSGVQCTMRDASAKATVGQQVTVKGFCSGYTMVVVMSDCVLEK